MITSTNTISNPQVYNIPDRKLVSFQSEQSIASGSVSSKKKYFLKRSKLSQQLSTSPSRSNIFDLTSGLNSSYLEVGISNHSPSQSRLFTNSLFSSPSKQQIQQNPQTRLNLPIITQSKYNFKPSIKMPKIKLQNLHEKAPLYQKQAQVADQVNMRKMKKYRKLWASKCQYREDGCSLLNKSVQKSDQYIQAHNQDCAKRKMIIQFETMLRDRHLKQANRIGERKGVPNRSLPGLKGKGGSVRSLYQEMYSVEEVYKFDK